MRRIARLFLTALLMFVGLSATAGTAVAAPEPATPFRFNDCTTIDITEICSSGHGFTKTEISASGNGILIGSITSTTTFTESGQVVFQASGSSRFVLAINSAGVSHSSTQQETTFRDGSTCTFTANTTFANGEVRHQISDTNCPPPV